MKFTVIFKDPDALWEAIDDTVNELKVAGLSDDELEAVKEKRKEEIREMCGKWFEFGEYLSVEIDTDKKSCTVVEI